MNWKKAAIRHCQTVIWPEMLILNVMSSEATRNSLWDWSHNKWCLSARRQLPLCQQGPTGFCQNSASAYIQPTEMTRAQSNSCSKAGQRWRAMVFSVFQLEQKYFIRRHNSKAFTNSDCLTLFWLVLHSLDRCPPAHLY